MYRTIDASFWTDPDIRALSGTERYLFLYLVTNPHAHVSGMYYLPKVMIEHETGLKGKALERGIDTLSKGYLAWYDPKNEVIFVRSMFRYQGRGEKNNQAAANQLKNLHKSQLINKFLKYYPEIQERLGIGYRYPIEGVSEFGTPDQDQEQEHSTSSTSSPSLKKDSTKTKTASAVRAREAPDRIFKHWNSHDALTRHRSLTNAMRASIKARLQAGHSEEDLCRAISRYAELCQQGQAPGHNQWGLHELISREQGVWIDRMLDPKYRGIQSSRPPPGHSDVSYHNAQVGQDWLRKKRQQREEKET